MGKAEKEKKLKLSVRSFPTRRVIENSKKIVKKFKKQKKYHYGFISSQNRLEKNEKKKIKIKIINPLRSTRRETEHSKKIAI